MSNKELQHLVLRLTLAGLFISLFVLTGCTTLDDSACRTDDWRSIGYKDAVSGRKIDHMADYRASCAAYPSVPASYAYRQGYAEGLREYCHPSLVFQLGRNGKEYPTQCADETADQLKTSYGYGRNIYELDADIGDMHRALHDKQRELTGSEVLLATTMAELEGQGVASARRLDLLEQSRQQSMRIAVIKAELEELNFRLTTRQTQLERLVSVLQ